MFEGSSWSEQLGHAFKAGLLCNIRLKGDPHLYQKVKIGWQGSHRYAIMAEGKTEVREFTLEDIIAFEMLPTMER